MKQRIRKWAFVTGSVLLLAGCEGTTTKVQVRPPAALPAPVPPPEYVKQPLPLPDRPLSVFSLRLDIRPAIDILVERVQGSLSASQREFTSGNPDKGRPTSIRPSI